MKKLIMKKKSFVNLKGLLIIFVFVAVLLSTGIFFAKNVKAISCPQVSSSYVCPTGCYNSSTYDPNTGQYIYTCLKSSTECCPSGPGTSPSPVVAQIVISGELNFEGPDGTTATCPNSLNNLAGSLVVLYNNSNAQELGRANASYSSSTGKVTFLISAKKTAAGNYKLKATKSDYWDRATTFITSNTSYSRNMRMKPKTVYIEGRVIDEKTREGISEIFVEVEGEDAYSESTSKGFYSLKLSPAENEYIAASLITTAPENSPYADRIYTKGITAYCPINYADLTLVKNSKVCEKPGGMNVEICWWGQKAIDLKNDVSYQGYWIELARLIEQLRAKTNSFQPPKLNIIGYDHWGAYVSVTTREIYINSGMIRYPGAYRKLTVTTLPHEFAHSYEFGVRPDIAPVFEGLLAEGKKLVLSKPDYTDTTVYKILTPFWEYYGSEYGFPDNAYGYAGTHEIELFAETFATMYTFDSKMHSKIADTTFPSDLRAYAKKVHNASAGFWPHGNTITLDKIKAYFVLKLAN